MLEDIEKVIDKLKIYDRCLIDHKADDYYYIYLESDSKIIEIDLVDLKQVGDNDLFLNLDFIDLKRAHDTHTLIEMGYSKTILILSI